MRTAPWSDRALRRRRDGSRGPLARFAWRRLVRACAEGDPAAQDAVRTAELPEPDVLDLLAAAPEQPADRAAYLTLIGQHAQRQALDPDGSLLALGYRAAAGEVRERLRTVMAADGNADVVRVVVSGDRRDRVAELSYDELDYLGHQLAERQEWAELRRLTRDLPLPKAVTAARLLPARERTAEAVELLARASPGPLRALTDRLPQYRRISHDLPVNSSLHGASFSPDTSELALRYLRWRFGGTTELHVETLRIGTGEGEVTPRFSGSDLWGTETGDSVLHLGDEVLITVAAKRRDRILRILPANERVGGPASMARLRRTSRGAVVLCPEGPAFLDPGADGLRHRPLPQFTGSDRLSTYSVYSALATLPGARLLAFVSRGQVYMASEDGDILAKTTAYETSDGTARHHPALSFLAPDVLVLHCLASPPENEVTEIWEFPPDGAPSLVERRLGKLRDGWPLSRWRVPVLDDAFAARAYNPGVTDDLPWLPPRSLWPAYRQLLTLSPGQDMFVTIAASGSKSFEVHSPHLPAARALLERPLLHCRPEHLLEARDLCTRIGDPAVRDALGLLAHCLTDRFDGDIAPGTADAVPSAGPHDIALTRDSASHSGQPQGDT
ncbi:hypothetical protein QQY66_37820 [Streptomyces sp. DG2A-72]|uniref:hypothetical protein n=1 Tax=Streptomyces sp. DG2A-72 TaxID=3051386 RepID=UPI00265B9803|nr:hypothetical protein [Streptomyces sp. DG2A-72]MDO0937200.1 hypothetical protein [Streptomyces sp. DG2A-72]